MSDGVLLGVAMCAAVFLPVLGARTQRARRLLLVAGAAAALAIGWLTIQVLANPAEGFWPSEAGWAFIGIAMPLGASFTAVGVVLILTRPTRLSDRVRLVLAGAAFLLAPFVLFSL